MIILTIFYLLGYALILYKLIRYILKKEQDYLILQLILAPIMCITYPLVILSAILRFVVDEIKKRKEK